MKARRPRRAFGIAALAVAVALAAGGVEAGPLHDAVEAGDRDAVARIVEAGADVDAVNEQGLTPLLQAIIAGNDAVTAALLDAGAAVNRSTEVKGEVLRKLGADIEPNERTHVMPLSIAVFAGNRAAVERLLRAKADVRAAADNGMKPLHFAAFAPDAEIARALLDGGAAVNDRDAHESTPLHIASARGNSAVATVLLARGAHVNAMDEEGRTPLDVASVEPSPELVELLASHGAVAMQEMLDARIDVTGRDPRLVPLVDRSILDRIAPAAPRPLGIAIDAAGSKLFWTEYATGAIKSSDLDGANVTVITNDLSGPIGLALDAAGRKLYWTCDATYPRKVQRADLDGSNVVDLASGKTVNRPLAIALDATGGNVIWTESIAGRIRRASLDGSDAEDIVTSGISSESDRPDAREFKPLGVAVDGANHKVYWTDMIDAQISRADLDGSNVETIVDQTDGLELPAGLVLDGARMYWADAGAAKIQRANTDGSATADVLTAADGLIEPYALALDASAGRIYWADASAGTINSATLAGEDVRKLVALNAAGAGGTHSGRLGAKQSPGDACADASAAATERYVLETVNAVGTCLRKVDALKAVWRRQADGARASSSCRRQLDRLAGGPDASIALEGRLRTAVEHACGDGVADLSRAGDGPLRALLAQRCAAKSGRDAQLDCVVGALRDAAYSRIALQFRRGAEWLEEVRPFIAAAPDAATTAANALVNLDRLHAALRAMGEGKPATATKTSRRDAASSRVGASGQTASYAARGVGGSARWTAVNDDGVVRSGASGEYVDNRDGTITDLGTGLMWEKKCDACGGLHDADAQYALDPSSGAGGVFEWLAALNSEHGAGYAEFSDWRLPTVRELQSILDYERFNPAVPAVLDGDACGLGCTDLTAPECSCTGMTWHCSATAHPTAPERVFGVAFNLGIIGDLRKAGPCAVRAVRDADGRQARR